MKQQAYVVSLDLLENQVNHPAANSEATCNMGSVKKAGKSMFCAASHIFCCKGKP
jgi:hypothetical protein